MKTSFFDKLLDRLDRVNPEELQNHLLHLAREKGFLETIFNTLQEGILVIDPDGKILYLNQSVQELLGINPEEALGGHVKGFIKELDWDMVLRGQQVVSRDLEVTYPEARYLHFYVVPLAGDGTHGVGFAAIFHDLTERREKTREAIESEKVNALTLLAAGVAHELGNPLNSLHIHFQLLERDMRKLEALSGKAGDRVRESLKVVKSEITRLDTIISQFLGAVRPTQQARQRMGINRLVEESVAFLQPEIHDKDILVETELADGLPAVVVDPDQMKQAFYNLIKNAVQAMSQGGLLQISTAQGENHVVIAFRDNGGGIKPEDVTRIFEPYFTTKKTGSGLGLLIVRRIVREHGGELELQSEEGRGTTFRILLPLSERRVRMLPPSSASSEEGLKV